MGPFAAAVGPLVACGFRVVPLKIGDKELARRWRDGAASDAESAERVARTFPRANIGIETGNGLVVIDVDVKRGKTGFESLFALIARLGPLPHTVIADTSTGGAHFYFRVPPELCVKTKPDGLADWIDVLGERGRVVAPPSVYAKTGGAYAWRPGHAPWETEVAVLPPAWITALPMCPVVNGGFTRDAMNLAPGTTSAYGRTALYAEAARVANAPEGQRNLTLNHAVFRVAQLAPMGHVNLNEVAAVFDDAAAKAGLGHRERSGVIQRAVVAGLRNPRSIAPPRFVNAVPALTIATCDALAPVTFAPVGVERMPTGYRLADARGQAVAGLDVPTVGLDQQLIASIGRGVGKLGSMTGLHVLQWEVITAHRQQIAKRSDFRRIEVQGGLRGLATLLGAPSAADDVRDVLHAQAHAQFTFARGARGNLLQYVETPAAPGRPALLVLVLGDPLLPGYAATLPMASLGQRQRRDRWLVPVLAELPHVHAVPPNQRAAAVRLHWLFLREFASHAKDLELRGGVPLSDARWRELAALAGLRLAHLPRLLDSWCEPFSGPAFLATPEAGIWTLAPEHAAETQFVLQRREDWRERRRAKGFPSPSNDSPNK